MKRNLLFLFLLITFVINLSYATHIVGGELQMTFLSNTATNATYRITLNMYWDRVSNVKDNSITIGFYRKSNNTRVQTLTLPLIQEIDLQFPVDTCTNQVLLRFTKLVYQANVTLSYANYSDVQGYYVTWERCCRNNAIVNIVAPGNAANSFYLEFAPIFQGGSPFINNSPEFPTPQTSYLCLNADFTFPFGATDADGDQLVYSMVTPYNGIASNFNPNPAPPATYSPYPPPEITWATGYSATNAIPSNVGQPLTVNPSTGLLSGNPGRTGLFVFSVRCEEYRAGVKIGEVRRDYQILVKNCQELNPNPEIRLQLQDNSIYNENTLYELDANKGLCLNLQIFDTPNQNIRLTYLPLNANAQRLTQNNYRPFRNANNQPVSGVTINSSGIGVVRFCWRECLYSFRGDEVFEFGIIADDQGCPVRGLDTLFVKFKVKPRFNNPPSLSIVSATPNFDIPSLTANPFLPAGQEVRITFQAFDRDNDSLKIFAVGRDFNIDSLEITFTPKEGRGRFTTDFIWKPDCRFIKANGQDDEYLVDIFLVEKNNTCDIADAQMTIKLKIYDNFSNVDSFLPANIFTPNGDGINDFFEMENLPAVADFNKYLPADNCLYRYNGIKIYNRWGKQVYESKQRDFKWDGGNLPAGAYFYVIDYTSRIFKGTVTIMK
ncbi:MAG: gliding motility-associated C-terminal domain-containing protein [Raineya sp.]|nr:gliding motility-associated C-terminal domain-containing protein [Raineya sp.]